jgi:hypothetical protein
MARMGEYRPNRETSGLCEQWVQQIYTTRSYSRTSVH